MIVNFKVISTEAENLKYYDKPNLEA